MYTCTCIYMCVHYILCVLIHVHVPYLMLLLYCLYFQEHTIPEENGTADVSPASSTRHVPSYTDSLERKSHLNTPSQVIWPLHYMCMVRVRKFNHQTIVANDAAGNYSLFVSFRLPHAFLKWQHDMYMYMYVCQRVCRATDRLASYTLHWGHIDKHISLSKTPRWCNPWNQDTYIYMYMCITVTSQHTFFCPKRMQVTLCIHVHVYIWCIYMSMYVFIHSSLGKSTFLEQSLWWWVSILQLLVHSKLQASFP